MPFDFFRSAFDKSVGVSYQPKNYSRWSFAYGIYAPFGIGLQHGKDSSRYSGERVEEDRIIYASPTVAYRVTDSLSVGASIGLGYSNIGATLYTRAPNSTTGLMYNYGVISSPFASLGKLDMLAEDDTTTSFNVGMLWQPVDWFSFGAVYQSESTANQDGDYQLKYTKDFKKLWTAATGMGLVSGPAKDKDRGTITEWKENFPKRLQMGIMVKPFRNLKLLCDSHWIDYRCKQADQIYFDKNVQLLQLATALGYKGGPKRLTVDLALAYIYNDSHRIPKNTSKVLNSPAEGGGMIYNPYSGLDYEQRTRGYISAVNVSYKW